ncbi:MAG: hypothetical protein ACRYG8_42940 [Janthinobacterium lividum]
MTSKTAASLNQLGAWLLVSADDGQDVGLDPKNNHPRTISTTAGNTLAGRAGIEARAEGRKRHVPPHLTEAEKARWYAGWDSANETGVST